MKLHVKRYVVLQNCGDAYIVADLYLCQVIAWFYKDDAKGTTIERACDLAKHMNTLEKV